MEHGMNVEAGSVASTAVRGISHIATLPEVTVRIIELVEDPSSSARDLHQLVSSDPALTARMLKVVNSAFYGLPRQIASINRAVSLLGLNAVKNIAVAASLAKLFRGGSVGRFDAQELWTHCCATATAAKVVADLAGRERWHLDDLRAHELTVDLDLQRLARPDAVEAEPAVPSGRDAAGLGPVAVPLEIPTGLLPQGLLADEGPRLAGQVVHADPDVRRRALVVRVDGPAGDRRVGRGEDEERGVLRDLHLFDRDGLEPVVRAVLLAVDDAEVGQADALLVPAPVLVEKVLVAPLEREGVRVPGRSGGGCRRGRGRGWCAAVQPATSPTNSRTKTITR